VGVAPHHRWSPRRFDAERSVPAEDLRAVLEAARWSASCYGEEPWRFLLARRSDPGRPAMESALSSGNAWAKRAGALLVGVAKRHYTRNGKPNDYARHDLGIALGSLMAEAMARGLVTHAMAGFDADDAFSRRAPCALPLDSPAIRRPGPIKRLAIPEHPQWFGDQQAEAAWNTALSLWRQQDVELVPLDFSPMLELAALLYEGPWVAERHAAVESFMANHGSDMNPVVKGIIGKATKFTATDTFGAQYRKEELLRQIDELLADIDALLVPTAPTAPNIEAVTKDPVTLNSQLGTFTNFVNLADFSALAIPAGFRDDGLPFGVTLISGAWKDTELQHLACQWLNAHPTPLGAIDKPISTPTVQVAVVGAHLSGMPLNNQLTERYSVLLEQTTTSANYRLYALPNTTPPKPGLKRVAPGEGEQIIVEVWEMPASAFGSFVDLIPAPLGIGNVELADGRWVNGFICEGYGFEGARDVTEFGGWRRFLGSGSGAGTGV
jgi:allophanate hydrolase